VVAQHIDLGLGTVPPLPEEREVGGDGLAEVAQLGDGVGLELSGGLLEGRQSGGGVGNDILVEVGADGEAEGRGSGLGAQGEGPGKPGRSGQA
jgi:hypothetical protein